MQIQITYEPFEWVLAHVGTLELLQLILLGVASRGRNQTVDDARERVSVNDH